MTESALSPLLAVGADDSQEAIEEDAWMPGLPTLRAQQRQLVDRLRDGFEERRELLLWTHAVAVLSLGYVDDDWFSSLLSDRYRVAATLKDQSDRDALSPHAPSEEAANYVRDDIQQDALSQSFQRAREEIRSASGDFTDTDDPGSPAEQRFLAMRPRVHQYAVAQHNALLDAFSEFESRRELLDWVDQLDYATMGYLPPDFPRQVSRPTSDWWHLFTNNGDDPSVWLELRLADTVLPAANEALRDAMQSGTEEPASVRETSVPTG